MEHSTECRSCPWHKKWNFYYLKQLNGYPRSWDNALKWLLSNQRTYGDDGGCLPYSRARFVFNESILWKASVIQLLNQAAFRRTRRRDKNEMIYGFENMFRKKVWMDLKNRKTIGAKGTTRCWDELLGTDHFFGPQRIFEAGIHEKMACVMSWNAFRKE